MFRAQSAHHQEVKDANCTYAASGIVTLCKLSFVYLFVYGIIQSCHYGFQCRAQTI